jgi:hypothetical protein
MRSLRCTKRKAVQRVRLRRVSGIAGRCVLPRVHGLSHLTGTSYYSAPSITQLSIAGQGTATKPPRYRLLHTVRQCTGLSARASQHPTCSSARLWQVL